MSGESSDMELKSKARKLEQALDKLELLAKQAEC